jgi:hypothetical protein
MGRRKCAKTKTDESRKLISVEFQLGMRGDCTKRGRRDDGIGGAAGGNQENEEHVVAGMKLY